MMCNRIGNFINLLMSCVMALVVSVSVAGAEKLTPDTGIDGPIDTPVQKVCACRDCGDIPCDTTLGYQCNCNTCSCDYVGTVCSASSCKSSVWSKCPSGNWFRIYRRCEDGLCKTTNQYRCPAGSYGTLNSCDGECEMCPSNATCVDELDDKLGTFTYTCNINYYDAAGLGRKECLPCPVDDNTTCGSGRFSCKSGYYRMNVRVRPTFGGLWDAVQEYRCEKCPNEATTSGWGATRKTECYLPKNTSEPKTYEDSYGKFEVSGDCFWTQ